MHASGMSAQKISIFSCCNKALIAPTTSQHLNKGRSGSCFFLFTSSQTSWLISYPLAKIQRKHLDENQGNSKSSAYLSKRTKSFFSDYNAKTVAVPVHPRFRCKTVLGVALSNQQRNSAATNRKLHNFPKQWMVLWFRVWGFFYFFLSNLDFSWSWLKLKFPCLLGIQRFWKRTNISL